MSTTTHISNLVINRLTKAQYDAIQNPDPNQLYFIVDENNYATIEDLPQPSNNNPNMDGTAAPGISATYSRSDHIHPTELPSQSGNSGKFLTTNGSAVSWAVIATIEPETEQNVIDMLAEYGLGVPVVDASEYPLIDNNGNQLYGMGDDLVYLFNNVRS